MNRREFLGCCCGTAAMVVLNGFCRDAWGEASIDRWTRTVCDLCGLGEPVFLGSGDGQLTSVKGIPNSTIGFGRLCPRAQALWVASSGERRALHPMVRRDPTTKGTAGGLDPASWDEALAFAAQGISAVRDRLGTEGVAFLASDGETNETYHLLGRISRCVFHTDNIDTPARLDALHAYDACRDVFGIPGNPASLEDVDAAGLIVLVGGDLADSHPGLFYRVLDSRKAARSQVVLIDPRKTLAAGVSDVHLRPLPGRELCIVNALTARLVADRIGGDPEQVDPLLQRQEITARWRRWLAGDLSASAPRCRHPLEDVSRGPSGPLRLEQDLGAAGIHPTDVQSLAGAWRDAKGVVTIVSPTVLAGPAGKGLATAVAQLHRATGNWGGPGKGVIFLPKGANATGVVAHGVAPGRLPGGRYLESDEDRYQVAHPWAVQMDRLPQSTGLPLLEWPAAIESGRIGALVVLRANPAVDFPRASRWRDSLASAFVVAAATHTPTETEAFADVVLPLALVSGESDGTMMALDRRCQLLERVVPPPGDARTAGEILLALARTQQSATDYEQTFAAYEAGAHVAWDEWRTLSKETPLDSSGITLERLREQLGVKWPCLAPEDPGVERLGPDTSSAIRVTEEGASIPSPVISEPRPFVPTPLPECLPLPSGERPFLLVGGPIREHFRSRVRTGLVPELHFDAPVARIEMHPADGSSLGVADGGWITLTSKWGRLTARVWLTDRSPQGVLYVPEHFGFLSDIQGGTDTLKEPEGLFSLVTGDDLMADSGGPAGLIVPVSVHPSRRRDMRRRGLRS